MSVFFSYDYLMALERMQDKLAAIEALLNLALPDEPQYRKLTRQVIGEAQHELFKFDEFARKKILEGKFKSEFNVGWVLHKAKSLREVRKAAEFELATFKDNTIIDDNIGFEDWLKSWKKRMERMPYEGSAK